MQDAVGEQHLIGEVLRPADDLKAQAPPQDGHPGPDTAVHMTDAPANGIVFPQQLHADVGAAALHALEGFRQSGAFFPGLCILCLGGGFLPLLRPGFFLLFLRLLGGLWLLGFRGFLGLGRGWLGCRLRGGFLPLGGLPAVGFRRFRSGLLRRFLDGFRGGGSFGFLLYRTLFLFGLFLLLLFGLAGSEDLPADFRGGFRGLEVLHGSGGIHRLGFGFRLILRGLQALIFFCHGASSFLAY